MTALPDFSWSRRKADPRARFEAMVSPEPNSGCYLWTGAIMKNGYGRFGVRPGDIRQAHRYALELDGRPPQDTEVVMHRCSNRACVNPAHLKAGTQLENIRQAVHEGMLKKKFRDPEGRWRA